jgi:hypothetical protein
MFLIIVKKAMYVQNENHNWSTTNQTAPEVNAQVAMHNQFARPGELAPRDLRFTALDLVGQALA